MYSVLAAHLRSFLMISPKSLTSPTTSNCWSSRVNTGMKSSMWHGLNNMALLLLWLILMLFNSSVLVICLHSLDLTGDSTWPVLAWPRVREGCRWSLGTGTSWSKRLIDSAYVKSSTYLRWILLTVFKFFLDVITSSVLLTWPSYPRSLIKMMNKSKPNRVPCSLYLTLGWYSKGQHCTGEASGVGFEKVNDLFLTFEIARAFWLKKLDFYLFPLSSPLISRYLNIWKVSKKAREGPLISV